MVLKWPKAFGTSLLETAIIPNTSNIRLIRKCGLNKKNNYDDQYWNELIDWTTFHHNFWKNNNHLHSELKSKYEARLTTDYSIEKESLYNCNFYQEFTELRRAEFYVYHVDTWKRNLNLVKSGYRRVFGRLNILNYFYTNNNYKFENKQTLIKE